MSAAASLPRVSVVVATHNRRERLAQLLEGLRAQTLPREDFEVVVVDDASTDRTPELLAEELGSDLRLQVMRLEQNVGRAGARERGWRSAAGSLIAFTDDDCVPAPGWLEAGLAAAGTAPEAIVQGRTEPNPAELEQTGGVQRAFTRTIRVPELDPGFATCNLFYPRELLERVGGFDTDRYGRVHGGEDSDLAWRVIGTGARAAFEPDALVYHAVNRLGPMGKLRVAASWELRAYVDHPGLRRAHFTHLVFWKRSHYLLFRFLLALALPRALRFLGPWLALPYLRDLVARGRVEGGGAVMTPYFLVHDLVEMAATARSGVRYRTPML